MDLILYFDYIGTIVFAISGTLSAAEKKLDLFGAMVIGFVTAVGGGTVRDMMLGDFPVTWMRSMDYFVVIILGVLITIVFKKHVLRLKRALFLFDTIGIGVFTIIGLEKALNMNIDAPLAVMMGLSTAVVGGVIRDTLCNDVPLIFKREIYATACIAGALVYLLLIELNVPQNINEIITVLTIIGVRLLAVHYNIKIPLLILSSKNS